MHAALGRRALAAHSHSRLSRLVLPQDWHCRYRCCRQLLQQKAGHQRRGFRSSSGRYTKQPGEGEDNGQSPEGGADGSAGGKAGDPPAATAASESSPETTAPKVGSDGIAVQTGPAPAVPSDEPELLRRSRARIQGVGLRARMARNKVPDELPPVTLPENFMWKNVLLHDEPNAQDQLRSFNSPGVMDWNSIQRPLVDLFILDLCSTGTRDSKRAYQTLENAFDAVAWTSFLANKEVTRKAYDAIERRTNIIIELAGLMTSVCAYRLESSDGVRTFAAMRRAQSPPFLPSDSSGPELDRQAVLRACAACRAVQLPSPARQSPAVQSIFEDLVAQDRPPHYLVPWLHFWAYYDLKNALAGEFAVRPVTRAHQDRDAKRPITVLTVPNYNGKRFAKAAVSATASAIGADLVYLDARSLSITVGAYLDQDWTFSRGPISMLGFRAAELNGRIGKPPETAPRPAPQGGGDDGDDTTTMLNIHAPDFDQENRYLEKELQKIREGPRDYLLPSVDRWENLKINAALERVLVSVEAKAADLGLAPQKRKIVVHVDDVVELSMTLEGSLLLGRLRSIADGIWKKGGRMVVVGTSSYENPSEQFQSALDDLIAEECHVSCPLQLGEHSFWGCTAGELQESVKLKIRTARDSLPEELLRCLKDIDGALAIFSDPRIQPPDAYRETFKHADYFEETINNLEHVLATIAPTHLLDHFNLLASQWSVANAPWGQKFSRNARDPAMDEQENEDDEVDEEVAVGVARTEEGKASGRNKNSEDGPNDELTMPYIPLPQSPPMSYPKAVLPQPVTYDMARQFYKSYLSRSSWDKGSAELGTVLHNLFARRGTWTTGDAAFHPSPSKPQSSDQEQPAHAHPGHRPGHSGHPHSHHHSHHPHSSSAKAGPNGRGGNFNEHEKRLLSGLVRSTDIRTTFADIHVPAETVTTLRLLTSLSLIRPEALSYGILARERMPGCLLYGPPGTGKTLLARAIAKESGANVLEVTGASIEDMYVGESEKNVRAVFSLARAMGPMVVFIDEADSLLGSRSVTRARQSRRETLNQFLREWDGMNDTSALVMVATNRPQDLDDAVLRRLPRKILVDLPLQPDRTAILRILLRDEVLDASVSLDRLSRQASFYSGSDLKNLCVAAAMAAVREENEAADRHAGPDPHVYPPRRVLHWRHFERALREVGASVSADAPSLKAIRKFDEMYGRAGAAKKAKSMGFGVYVPPPDSESAMVRKAEAA